MAKTCWICEKKLNLLNSIPFDGNVICADCNELYDKMMYAWDGDEIVHSGEMLLSMCEKGSEAYEYINKYFLMQKDKYPSEEDLRAKKEREQLEKEIKQREEQEAREKARIEALEKQVQNDIFLKSNGHEGYYEYMAISVCDNNSGSVNIGYLNNTMNKLGREGWHLRCAFTNELGHNSNSGGVMGISTGTNATIDDNILIFERFIKFTS